MFNPRIFNHEVTGWKVHGSQCDGVKATTSSTAESADWSKNYDALRLFFLSNFPGPLFISCPIPDSELADSMAKILHLQLYLKKI